MIRANSTPANFRCDGRFDFLFYDIKAQLSPKDHGMACQVEFSIRSLVDSTSSLSLVLLPVLEISSLTAQGDDLTYERNDHELKIFLKEDLKKGDEQTFRIDYSGVLISVERGGWYDGYVGEEGVYMRTFAAWYPYCTSGPQCFHFPDVPYTLEVSAPLGWTLFAHPESPDVKQEADQMVYRWDGRQPHQRRPAGWGITLIGGKYHKIERKIGECNITFFGLEKSGKSMEKSISNLGELLDKLDEFSNMPSTPRQIRLAENADFLPITHQPAHTNFHSSRSFDRPRGMTQGLAWGDIEEWATLSEADFVHGEHLVWLMDLSSHLHQWFWADEDRSPEGWLAADLEGLLRLHLGIIQTRVQQPSWFDVRLTKGPWAWWMLRRMVGDEAFSRALHRLRTGAFPKDTVMGPRAKEFFSLISDEAGLPVDWFWEQWMERISAPQIQFGRVTTEERPGGSVVNVVLHQPGDVYRLPLDIVLRTDEEEICQSIFLEEREHHLAFRCKGKPETLEIDPERKIMKLPNGHPVHSKFFKPMDMGFSIAFGGGYHGHFRLAEREALRNGKRIVVAPTELLDVAEALKPYLQRRWGHMAELDNDGVDVDREQLLAGIPVEIYSADEVTEELLENHNLVLIGNPENNRLFEKMAISTMKFQQGRISAGEAMIEDEKQGLIAFGGHPQNAERFCLIVTALNNEALRQPPDFAEMPGDYLIYQGGKPLRVGFQTLRRCTYKIP